MLSFSGLCRINNDLAFLRAPLGDELFGYLADCFFELCEVASVLVYEDGHYCWAAFVEQDADVVAGYGGPVAGFVGDGYAFETD